MGRALHLIVAKAPLPGMTKTRLGATIGMDRAAALYAAFLVDLAARFTPRPDASRAFDFGWAYTPAEVDFGRLLAEIGCERPAPSVLFVPQVGDGWDIRQANLLRWGFDHEYERTVLTASDSPHLQLTTVEEAFATLGTHEVALGRTYDGGYYLIGMRGYHDILAGVPMSTITAADALVARAAEQGLSVAELPETFDVDEQSDLRHLRDELAPDGVAAPATWAALHQLGLADRDRETGEPTG
jgi:glycosyltransferase A (GT-A) superfamily protein (DUF2064 family)